MDAGLAFGAFKAFLAFKARRPRKLCLLPGKEGGLPARVSCCLATCFCLLRQSFPLAVPADARTTNDSNITAAVAPVAVYVSFMVTAMKGFVKISSHPPLVNIDNSYMPLWPACLTNQ